MKSGQPNSEGQQLQNRKREKKTSFKSEKSKETGFKKEKQKENYQKGARISKGSMGKTKRLNKAISENKEGTTKELSEHYRK